MDRRLLNGKPKCTVIQCFNHSTILLGPEFGKKKKFNNLEELKQYIQKRGWEASVSHIHPARNEKSQRQD